MLPACAPLQKPFQVYNLTSVTPVAADGGDSPAEACLAFSASIGHQFNDATLSTCRLPSAYSAGSYPVVKVCEPMFDGAPYDYAAGGALFGFAFTGVMILYFASLGIGHVIKAVRDM